jgi:D-tyrosyl-tRNA(Tyr) deacylase
MKAIIQRVHYAEVIVDSQTISKIGPGLLTLLGVEKGDTPEQVKKVVDKIIHLRIFEDTSGKMNLSLKDLNYEHLIVSQFTLAADCSQGRRPNFLLAESPARAKELYELALQESQKLGIKTLGGQFQAHMKIHLINDGPVTIPLSL